MERTRRVVGMRVSSGGEFVEEISWVFCELKEDSEDVKMAT